MTRLLAPFLLLLPSIAFGGEAPRYAVPEGLRGFASPDPRIEAIVGRIVRGEETKEGWRVLAGIGPAAAPAAIRGLNEAGGFGRALLMYALSESGASGLTGVFLAGSTDPAWAVREAAAAGLSRSAEPAAAARLTALLSDSSWRVRAAACLGLRRLVTRGHADRDSAIRALLPLGEDPDEDVRFAAVRELGNLEATEAIPLFVQGYLEGGKEERQDACLGYLTSLSVARDDLLAALDKALESSDDHVFLTAAETYARLTGPKLLDQPDRIRRLLDLLVRGSASEVASIRVASVMKNIGEKAAPVLLAELRRQYRSASRIPVPSGLSRTVLDIVESILGEKAAPVLLSIIRDWTEISPRRYAVLLAHRFHAKEMATTLAALYFDEKSRPIRAQLLGAIAAAEPPDLERHLDDAIRSGDYFLMRKAYEVLSEHEEIDLTGTIAYALARENDSPRIATQLLTLLADRDPAVAFRQATRLLTHDDPELRAVGARWIFIAHHVQDALALLLLAWPKEDGQHRGRTPASEERARPVREKVLGTMLTTARKRAGAGALPLLRLGAGDADPVVRERALEELSHLDSPEALALALAALDGETDLAVRRQALRAIVRSPDPRAVAVVGKALAGRDARIRMGVLNALGAVEEAPLPEIVVKALAAGRWEPEARLVAVQALGARSPENHVELLTRLARTDPDREVRQEAVRALAESGEPSVSGRLLPLLPSPGEGLAALTDEARALALETIHALGELRAKEATAPLVKLLDTEWKRALAPGPADRIHFDAVIQLALALGRIGDERAVAPMMERLFDPALYRDFGLLDTKPSGGSRNLLTGLVSALLGFPDPVLAGTAEKVVADRLASLEAYRIDESYLRYLAGMLADPLRSGIRRPRPRREAASVLDRLILSIAPRETTAGLTALTSLADRAAARGSYREAADLMARETGLRALLYPLDFRREEAYYRARSELLLGIALLKEGRSEEGRRFSARAVDRDPADPRILNLFAWWRAETGLDLPEALRAALAAGRRAPGDANVLDTLGWVLFRMGRFPEAASRLAAAADIEQRREDPSLGRFRDPLVLYHLAAALAALGRIEGENGALSVLADAVALDDTLAGAAGSAPWFQALRKAGRLSDAIREGLSRIPR